ncbi:hypothetical protein PF003_g36379 [Phytophthora fragariae]|nr:hypothetical protein PF003_g36379 [Phytophthora fragariae]
MNDALLVGMKGGVSGALAAHRGRAVGRLLLKEEALLEDMKDVLFAEESVLVEMEEAEHVLLAEDAVLVEHVLLRQEAVLVETKDVMLEEHVLFREETVLVEMEELEHVLLVEDVQLAEDAVLLSQTSLQIFNAFAVDELLLV